METPKPSAAEIEAAERCARIRELLMDEPRTKQQNRELVQLFIHESDHRNATIATLTARAEAAEAHRDASEHDLRNTLPKYAASLRQNEALAARVAKLDALLREAQEEMRLIHMKDTAVVYNPSLRVRIDIALAPKPKEPS